MKRLPWTKLPHSIFVDEAAAELGLPAAYLRVFLLRHCCPAEGMKMGGVEADPSIGWLVTETGRPYTVGMVQRMTPMSGDQVEEALFELAEVGIVVHSDEGAIGYVGWLWTQESPVTERTRRHREKMREGAAAERSGNVPGTDRGEEKRPEESKKRDGPAVQAPLLEIQDASYAEDIVALWHELRVELGLAEESQRPRMTPQRRKVIEGVAAEEWRVALRRMAARIRTDAERQRRPAHETGSAPYFTIDHLARAKNRQMYLDAPAFDRPVRPNRLHPPVEGLDIDEAEGLVRKGT